jgi:hypothetical protein
MSSLVIVEASAGFRPVAAELRLSTSPLAVKHPKLSHGAGAATWTACVWQDQQHQMYLRGMPYMKWLPSTQPAVPCDGLQQQ